MQLLQRTFIFNYKIFNASAGMCIQILTTSNMFQIFEILLNDPVSANAHQQENYMNYPRTLKMWFFVSTRCHSFTKQDQWESPWKYSKVQETFYFANHNLKTLIPGEGDDINFCKRPSAISIPKWSSPCSWSHYTAPPFLQVVVRYSFGGTATFHFWTDRTLYIRDVLDSFYIIKFNSRMPWNVNWLDLNTSFFYGQLE